MEKRAKKRDRGAVGGGGQRAIGWCKAERGRKSSRQTCLDRGKDRLADKPTDRPVERKNPCSKRWIGS